MELHGQLGVSNPVLQWKAKDSACKIVTLKLKNDCKWYQLKHKSGFKVSVIFEKRKKLQKRREEGKIRLYLFNLFCIKGMKLHLAVALIGLVFLESTSYAADSETDEVVKRRGWGKRDSYPIDALAVDAEDEAVENELEKRRGWGKRDFEKRRGWGKRSDTDSFDDEMEKRRGWGKRPSSTDADLLDDSEIAKRRGWGKRASVADLASELSQEMDKRRGWGKRSYGPFHLLDEADNSEMVDKRRGWGKRYGWGKRSDADLEEEKRYGWGKRAMGWGKRYVQRFSLVQNSRSSQLNKVLNS